MSTRSRRYFISGLVAFSAALVLIGAGATAASAARPWWHLSSGLRPATLQPGSAKDEVQRVVVSATGGTFALANLSAQEVNEIKSGELEVEAVENRFAAFPYNADAGTVQEGLEIIYGAGNVEVTGGPGDEGGTTPYVITFHGSLADQPIKLLNTELTEEFGLEGTVAISRLAAGRADGEIVLTAENLGDADVDGAAAEVSLSDTLPAGLHAIGISATEPTPGGQSVNFRKSLPCSLSSVTCTLSDSLAPYDSLEARIAVVAEPGYVSGAVNEARVSGGGAADTSVRRPVVVGGGPVPFGVEEYDLKAEDEGGAQTRQAGAHPFQLTTSLTLNQNADRAPLPEKPEVTPAEIVKDLNIKLPPGLIGNFAGLPKCTTAQFFQTIEGVENQCPPQSAVGVAVATINEPVHIGQATFTVPVFNVEPRKGEPARLGFYVITGDAPVFIDTALRTGGDYGATVSVANVTQTAAFLSSTVTVWGVPTDTRHDLARGWGCLAAAREVPEHAPCLPANDQSPHPLLSLPTSCAGPAPSTVEADSWVHAGAFVTEDSVEPLAALVGCNQLPFEPSLSVATDTSAASSPTGFTVNVHAPQEANENANGVSSANVKSVSVTLPPGVVVNASAADGLQGCTETQIGYLPGESAPPANLHFTPGLPAPRGAPAEPFCPDAAKVATVTIKTPLLPDPLHGFVYLANPQNFSAPPQENPFESLLAMYLVAEDPVSGSLVKLPGKVSLDPTTGQIVASFDNTPDLAFEDVEAHFFGGNRAPLATPALCGAYAAVARFTSWAGGPPVLAGSSFVVSAGPSGSACPATLPFQPSLSAGTSDSGAGKFSPFVTTVARPDGNQDLRSVSVRTPPGFSAILSNVPLCAEQEANAGTCAGGSLIGHSTASAGVGPTPFTVGGGQVFVTGPYRGAPFGLSIVTPAKAGPFDLGTVVVRAKLEIDPHTAQVTVVTDGSGPFAIPQILDGIPLELQRINVSIDRPGFTFNPTNCGPLSVVGSIGSASGAVAVSSAPFQATNCALLKFAPKFTVAATGRTSKALGAGLSVKLAYPAGSLGTAANIAKVKVELPKQLPSRLTTLQKACLAAVFDANPANCPSASVIGHAKVVTPLLPVPLTGPAYFVSHGGEAFPSLEILLQGYGVKIELIGATLIRKGVTSTTFGSTPDVPFSSFELMLPQGKFSALAANANLCKSKLTMPTAFVAQNGAERHQATKVVVTGCKKASSRKAKKKHRRKVDRRKAARRRSRDG